MGHQVLAEVSFIAEFGDNNKKKVAGFECIDIFYDILIIASLYDGSLSNGFISYDFIVFWIDIDDLNSNRFIISSVNPLIHSGCLSTSDWSNYFEALNWPAC